MGLYPSALGRADAAAAEFRLNALIDRVNTTWTVWQATTVSLVASSWLNLDAALTQ